MTLSVLPTTFEDAAAALAGAAAVNRSVRLIGGATKLGWGCSVGDTAVELRTTGLSRTIEHNAGDLTAIFEAGVPLARAQAELGAVGQRLALDPPLGLDGRAEATIGGVFATGDCGPLRHRYGAPRDQILGTTVALSDGTIAKAGGKVIKNVAGYDLAKLFTGSFGTLGLILSVSVRLHPLPALTATAIGASEDSGVLALAAAALSQAPLELEALDVAWRGGRGGLLAQSGGAEASRRSRRVAELMRDHGLEHVDVVDEDDALWARQRLGQRSADHALVRVSARPSGLAQVLALTSSCGGTLVGRAALGTSYVELEADRMPALVEGLPRGAWGVLLDAPAGFEPQEGRWGGPEGAVLELMRRVKQRFDPAGACNPGVFVGGI